MLNHRCLCSNLIKKNLCYAVPLMKMKLESRLKAKIHKAYTAPKMNVIVLKQQSTLLYSSDSTPQINHGIGMLPVEKPYCG